MQILKSARKAKCQVLNAYARNIFSDENKKKSFEKTYSSTKMREKGPKKTLFLYQAKTNLAFLVEKQGALQTTIFIKVV